MTILYKLQCPECGEKFRWEGENFPDFCPRCQAYVGVDPNFVPSRLNIGGSALAKSAEATYRALEQSSEVRAEMAGDPSLKITNMRDNLREGDVAAIMPQPSKTYRDAVAGMDYNPWSGGIGVDTNQALALAKQGGMSGTGRVVLETIQGGALPKAPNVQQSLAGLKAGFGGGG